MEIKTKYEIGQKVWVIYKNNDEVCVYSDEITTICLDKDGISYFLKVSGNDIKENELILYKDDASLVKKVKEIDNEFYTKEEK